MSAWDLAFQRGPAFVNTNGFIDAGWIGHVEFALPALVCKRSTADTLIAIPYRTLSNPPKKLPSTKYVGAFVRLWFTDPEPSAGADATGR